MIKTYGFILSKDQFWSVLRVSVSAHRKPPCQSDTDYQHLASRQARTAACLRFEPASRSPSKSISHWNIKAKSSFCTLAHLLFDAGGKKSPACGAVHGNNLSYPGSHMTLKWRFGYAIICLLTGSVGAVLSSSPGFVRTSEGWVCAMCWDTPQSWPRPPRRGDCHCESHCSTWHCGMWTSQLCTWVCINGLAHRYPSTHFLNLPSQPTELTTAQRDTHHPAHHSLSVL